MDAESVVVIIVCLAAYIFLTIRAARKTGESPSKIRDEISKWKV